VTRDEHPDGQEWQDVWVSLGIRTDIPHPARVYDYILGGKDNFAADREMAEVGLKHMPEMRVSSRENRAFLVRAVRFLRDAGIRQFLDIGTGLPTSPNTYEVAQEGHQDARVVYVDNDPVVVRHAQARMSDNKNIAVVPADLRDVGKVLAGAGELLDFSEPVGLLFIAVLHNIVDEDDPAGIAARYMAALAPGSYVVISHSTDEFAPERTHAASQAATERGATWLPRSRDAIARMFNGRALVDPGLVLVSRWRPDGEPGPDADQAWTYCGVAPVALEKIPRFAGQCPDHQVTASRCAAAYLARTARVPSGRNPAARPITARTRAAGPATACASGDGSCSSARCWSASTANCSGFLGNPALFSCPLSAIRQNAAKNSSIRYEGVIRTTACAASSAGLPSACAVAAGTAASSPAPTVRRCPAMLISSVPLSTENVSSCDGCRCAAAILAPGARNRSNSQYSPAVEAAVARQTNRSPLAGFSMTSPTWTTRPAFRPPRADPDTQEPRPIPA
jgi:S-adenosyl methyltransferase